ncbi:hypothetical protein WJX72_004366 [[Myrmecia] bisecta]|uniref:Uncharacterized protein n=1 Tax=[Myrmecia] bisecta TaxID=41462 RepID=A0AAW1QQB3_9CHLO
MVGEARVGRNIFQEEPVMPDVDGDADADVAMDDAGAEELAGADPALGAAPSDPSAAGGGDPDEGHGGSLAAGIVSALSQESVPWSMEGLVHLSFARGAPKLCEQLEPLGFAKPKLKVKGANKLMTAVRAACDEMLPVDVGGTKVKELRLHLQGGVHTLYNIDSKGAESRSVKAQWAGAYA